MGFPSISWDFGFEKVFICLHIVFFEKFPEKSRITSIAGHLVHYFFFVFYFFWQDSRFVIHFQRIHLFCNNFIIRTWKIWLVKRPLRNWWLLPDGRYKVPKSMKSYKLKNSIHFTHFILLYSKINSHNVFIDELPCWDKLDWRQEPGKRWVTWLIVHKRIANIWDK